mgnify:CR=1 FL=1
MRKLILSILTFFSFFFCFSQLSHPKIDEIGESKGLFLTNEVCDIEVDSEGIVWIITFSEIFKYNGSVFEEINTSNVKHGAFFRFQESYNGKSFVTDLNGEIYFISSDSIIEYENNHLIEAREKDEKPVDVFVDSSFNVYLTILAKEVISIKNGKLLAKKNNSIGKNIGFYFLSENMLQPIMMSVAVEPNGEAITEAPFYLINSKHEILDSTLLKKGNGQFRNIIQLRNKNYLIASNKGFILEVSKSRIERKVPFEPTILNQFIDKNNGLWISTAEQGIFYYENSLITNENEKRYFRDRKLIVSAEDKEGGLWLYSEKDGVFRIDKPFLKYFNTDNQTLNMNKIEVLELIGDSLLFVDRFDKISLLNLKNNQISYLEIMNSTKDNFLSYDLAIKDLAYDFTRNKLWACNSSDIMYFESGSWVKLKKNKQFDLYELQGKSLCEIEDNVNYSMAGINRNQFFLCDDTSFVSVSKPFPTFLNELIVIKDTVFVNAQNGLYKVFDESYLYFGEKHPELKKSLQDMFFFNDELWISSNNDGLFILKKDRLEPVFFHESEIINARLVKQDQNTLWIISDIGTFEVKKTKNSYTLSAFQALMQTHITNIQNSSKSVYFGTLKDGILRTDFKDLKRLPLAPPTLVINSIKIGDNISNNIKDTYTTNYDKSGVQLWYSTVSYSKWPSNFRYRLSGLEENWTYNNQGYLNYSYLDDGTYLLELQVRKGVQPWSESKSIEIIVLPPIWERWWFIIGSLLFISGLSYYLIANRVKNYNKEKNLIIARLKAEQKALRTKMEPHFVFNVISSLQYLVMNNKNEKASIFLEQFSTLMRTTLDHTNRDLVSIEEELDFVKKYVELEKFRLEDKFEFYLKISDSINLQTEIPNFLIQPFVENAIQHGLKNSEESGLLSVSVSKQGNMLEIQIEDNGVGYERTKNAKQNHKRKHKSHGISTVRERLELINGGVINNYLKIEDLKNKNTQRTGTKVTLLVKIKE